VQLLDDRAETSTRQIQEFKAFFLRRSVVLIIALVRRIVPNLPMRIISLVELTMRKQALPSASETPTIE
jgi:hypothetical protein